MSIRQTHLTNVRQKIAGERKSRATSSSRNKRESRQAAETRMQKWPRLWIGTLERRNREWTWGTASKHKEASMKVYEAGREIFKRRINNVMASKNNDKRTTGARLMAVYNDNLSSKLLLKITQSASSRAGRPWMPRNYVPTANKRRRRVTSRVRAYCVRISTRSPKSINSRIRSPMSLNRWDWCVKFELQRNDVSHTIVNNMIKNI